MIACGNAAGTYIPPHVIVPGKTFNATKTYDTENAPPGTKISVSDSGWTKQGIAEMWFTDNFMPNIGEQRPQLLILDVHDSHGHVALLELARKNNIILMELPAHTSNWTQPFDRTVFRPFKAKWFEACDEFVTLTGLDVKKPQFFRLLKKACLAMTPEVLQSGFRACGIVPLNMNAIPEEAYQPGTAYKSPNKGMEVSSAVSATDQSIDEPQPGQSVAVDELQLGQSVAVDELQPGQSVAVELQPDEPVAVDEPQPDGADLSLEFRLPNSEDLMNISSLMGMIVGDTSTDEAPEVVSLEQMSSKNADYLALHAVESSMTTEQHHQFLAAELSGQTVKNDPLFPAWKKYRTKNAKLEELFPIPTCTVSTRKRKS